ncbi:MAG: hypothetical protein IJV86_05635 [Clostridia bacterium]|nr:hypothetical protein [Clostridia bacterium]MBQ9737860.1 hypothetical protein [Clostridia bacterium]
MPLTTCETCAHYQYDEFWDCYVCSVNLDEDDMQRFLQGSSFECSFWQNGDEYSLVRKQN